MKIKLTPELSYIIGLWRKNRCFDGIGVKGDKTLLEVFSKLVLDAKLTTSDKLLAEDEKVYFYHTAYRKFFQEVEKEQLERFKYLNDYASSYLAGVFDGSGQIDERGVVSLSFANSQDELLLLRLGFISRRRADRLVIEKPLVFLAFIKNYLKIKNNHRAFDLIKTPSKKA
ncbi:hypothetical protein HY988_00945 [Candidatus Micrarchaeota archaeon]|nr:hypothetical protein [Candidatus Micrarchaeota archaeon]